jgi:HEAT repeat protein
MVVVVLLVVGMISLGTFAVVAGMWAVPTLKHLASIMKDSEDPSARCRAAWWLGEHEDRGGVGQCVDGLEDESASVRLVSAWALGEIKDEDAIEPLIDALENDEDVLVREMAALALGEIEDAAAVAVLVRTFEREEDLREAIIWALGEIENRGSRRAGEARVAAFEEMGKRPWRNEQVWAGHLGKRRPKSEHLREILDDLKSRDAEDRRDAALDLGYLGVNKDYDSKDETMDAVDALIVALRDPVPEVRAAACWSLDEINPSRWRGHKKSRGNWRLD